MGHPFVAAVLDLAMAPLAEVRGRVVPSARGRVLEIGLGTGLNLAWYGDDVTALDAVEPDPHMRRRALPRLSRLSFPVSVLPCGAEALPYEDDHFDDVVCTFTLCTIPEPARALDELRRVVREDGRLLFAEHVVSEHRATARLQTFLSPLWSRLAGGCRLDRSAETLVRDAGFRLGAVHRRGWWRGNPAPVVYGEAFPS